MLSTKEEQMMKNLRAQMTKHQVTCQYYKRLFQELSDEYKGQDIPFEDFILKLDKTEKMIKEDVG